MGLLHSNSPSRGGYDPAYYAELFAIEDRHFWFRGRNCVIATLVRQITAGLPSGYRVLEVGCGTGNVLRVMEQACSRGLVLGMDLFAEGLHYPRRRTGCPLVQADLHSPPFDTLFDLIGCFDVLEHLADDSQELLDLRGLLARDGVLLLTAPAHSSLWSYFDEASHHYRRYEVSELEFKLRKAGDQVGYSTQYMASIFPLLWLGRRLAGFIGRYTIGDSARAHNLAAGELHTTPVMNDLLTRLLTQEARAIARRCRLPVGTSLLAIARKTPAIEV